MATMTRKNADNDDDGDDDDDNTMTKATRTTTRTRTKMRTKTSTRRKTVTRMNRELRKELNIDMDPNIISHSNHEDMILYNKEKFKNHPSIKRIKDVTNLDRNFTFNFNTLDHMVNKINNLDLTKSNPLTSIPTKIVVDNSDIFAPILYNKIVVDNSDIFAPIYI